MQPHPAAGASALAEICTTIHVMSSIGSPPYCRAVYALRGPAGGEMSQAAPGEGMNGAAAGPAHSLTTRSAAAPGAALLLKTDGRETFRASAFGSTSHLSAPGRGGSGEGAQRAQGCGGLAARGGRQATARLGGRAGASAEGFARGTHTPSEAMMIRALDPGGTSNERMSGREMQARAQVRSPSQADSGAGP